MPRQIVGKGIRFSLRHAPCAHICRYCLISESRKRSALPFARFEQLVHCFYDWKQANGHIQRFAPIRDWRHEPDGSHHRYRARHRAGFRSGARLRHGASLR